MLSWPTVSGSEARANRRHEVGGRRNARRCGRSAASVGGSTGVTGSKRPLRSPGARASIRIESAPSQRSEPFAPTKTPRGFPRRRQSRRAPAAAVDEDRAGLELEDGRGRRSLPVPGMRRVPFAAIDARGREPGHAAQSVERMDRHVQEQDMVHLLAKSAEMRGEEEIGVNAGDVADRAALQRARDAAHAGYIAAVLHHGVNPSRDLRARDQIARFVERFRHRLFAQHMAARREARRDDLMTRRRHDDVEQQVGMGLVDQLVNVARDADVLQAEFAARPWRAPRRDRPGRRCANREFSPPPGARPDSSRRSRQGRP